MNSLRLWFGVAAVPVLTAFTIAVVEHQQRAPDATVTLPPAANSGELSPVPSVEDKPSEEVTLVAGFRGGYRAVGVRARVESTPGAALAPHAHVRMTLLTDKGDGKRESTVLVEDAVVLAVEGPPADGKLAKLTLALMAEDMLKVRLADEERRTLIAVPLRPTEQKR